MKRIIITSALVTSLFVTGLASAQDALFPSNNASAQVTFYHNDPATSAPLATVMVNNSPFAMTISGVEAASYITVVHQGESYTFALAESGDNKNEVWLELGNTPADAATYVSDSGTMSLTALMDGLSVHPNLLEELQSDTFEL